ncbi:MAG: hypothetical protein KBE65_06225 [Phycisphaerae bacterium]|nr:hypothetical protein [Phycisphaerae bacterium]
MIFDGTPIIRQVVSEIYLGDIHGLLHEGAGHWSLRLRMEDEGKGMFRIEAEVVILHQHEEIRNRLDL